MIKGIGRQIILLNNTESEIFEQAIFILRANGKTTHGKVLKECERMINVHVCPHRKTIARNYWKTAFFAMTALAGILAVICLL